MNTKSKVELPASRRRDAGHGASPHARPLLPQPLRVAALTLALALVAGRPCTAADPSFGRLLVDPEGTPRLLLGTWERYVGYVTDASLATAPQQPAQASARMRQSLFAPPERPVGPLTYRLRIELAGKPEHRDYALYIPELAEYRAVMANGELLYARDRDRDPPRELRFTSDSAAISLVLQSDEDGPRLEAPGALPGHILFGEARRLSALHLLLASGAALEIGYFVLGGIFLFLLFVFWRKNRDFLAFARFMAAAAALAFLQNAGILDLISPASIAAERLCAAAIALQALALGSFVATTLGKRIPGALAWGIRAAAAAVALAALLPLAVPETARVLSAQTLHLAAVIFYAALGLAILVWIGVLAFHRERHAAWLLPGLLLVVASTHAPWIAPASLATAYFLEPAGLIAFAFLSMLMLVKRVGDSFESVETLSGYVTKVAATVKRFIPKEFLDYLNKAEITDLALGDHVKKEMTIFFSDIRAFTELSEKLTIEENFAFINSYLSRVVPLITENGGFVDKYVGDAIMALFPGQTGPDAAIRTAIAMQKKIVEYNGHRAKMGYRPISMGVGIHTGDLMLGVVGVNDRMENTVISDAVNLASRLQAITKAFNIGLAISERAFKELEDPGSYKYRFIGKVKVKGKAAPVSVFEIFDGLEPELFERKMKANTFFEQGMLSYYQKDFAGAMYYFKRVLDQMPEDGAAAFYLENCMAKASL